MTSRVAAPPQPIVSSSLMHETAGFDATRSAEAQARVLSGPPRPGGESNYRAAFRLLGAASGLLALAIVLYALTKVSDFVTLGAALASLLALSGCCRALVGLFRTVRSDAVKRGSLATGVLALLGNLLMSLVGMATALLSVATFSRGRQLRRFGRILLAPIETSGRWLGRAPHTPPVAIADSQRAALAAQWRANGRTEHASVAAFSRLSLDLLALGAPASLIAAAHADALDEIRHAELCFSLASSIDGQSLSPGAFPAAARARTLPSARLLALSVLAVDSLVDGALHEGVSARVVARLARSCEEPTIRALLKQIAADEGRHAAHGWDVVEFCLAEGGEPVAQALCGAAQMLPMRLSTSSPPAARTGAWERYGIPGEQLEQAEFDNARADLLRRLAQLTCTARATAA